VKDSQPADGHAVNLDVGATEQSLKHVNTYWVDGCFETSNSLIVALTILYTFWLLFSDRLLTSIGLGPLLRTLQKSRSWTISY